MTKEDLVFALSCHGAGCDGCGYEHNCKHGTCRLMVEAAALIQVMAGEGAQLRKWANRFAAALGDKIIANNRMEEQLASLTAERDAAVDLIGKLDQCVMMLDAAKEPLIPNPAVQQTIRFAVKAMEGWRTREKQPRPVRARRVGR